MAGNGGWVRIIMLILPLRYVKQK